MFDTYDLKDYILTLKRIRKSCGYIQKINESLISNNLEHFDTVYKETHTFLEIYEMEELKQTFIEVTEELYNIKIA